MNQQLLGVVKLVMAVSPDAAKTLVEALQPDIVKALNANIDQEFQILNNVAAPSMYEVERINDLTKVRDLLRIVHD